MSVTDASAPFDKASNIPSLDNYLPASDIVARSCDGVDFHVHKTILGRASHTLAALLSGEGSVSELAATSGEVVPFAEDARTLDALFRLCYPVANPVLATARDVFNVMEASKKYMVEHATKFCLEALMAPPLSWKRSHSASSISHATMNWRMKPVQQQRPACAIHPTTHRFDTQIELKLELHA